MLQPSRGERRPDRGQACWLAMPMYSPIRYSKSRPFSAASGPGTGRAREESRQRQRAGELAVGRDQVSVRRRRRTVDHRLGGRQGGPVEGGQAGRHRVHEVVELGVRQSPA